MPEMFSSLWFWALLGFVWLWFSGQKSKAVPKPLIVQRADTPEPTTSDDALYAMRIVAKRMEEVGVPAEERTRWQNETAVKLLVQE